MALASANRVVASIIEEVTPGTTPATATTILRVTNVDPKPVFTPLKSNEIRPDRQVTGFRLGAFKGELSLPTEVFCGDINTLLEGALSGDFDSSSPKVLKAGTTLKYYSVPFGFTDIAQYGRARGCVVNTLDIDFPADALPTLSFGLVCMDMDDYQGTPYDASPSPIAAGTHEPSDTFSGSMKEGGSAIAILTSAKISINNNRGLQPVLGSRTSPEAFEGKLDVTGSVTAMFKDASLLNKYLNETSTSLEIQCKDVNGTDYVTFVVPKVRYTTGAPNVPATGPVMVNLDFIALYDATAQTNLKVLSTL